MGFAFPDNLDVVADSSKRFFLPRISLEIRQELVQPELDIRLRRRSLGTSRMPMPEASMHEDREAACLICQIGTSWNDRTFRRKRIPALTIAAATASSGPVRS